MVFYGILRLGKNSGILWNFTTGTMERNNYANNFHVVLCSLAPDPGDANALLRK